MNNFFTLNLWFAARPGALQPVFLYALIGLVVIFLLSAFITWHYHKQNKKNLYGRLWNSAYNFCLTGTIIGALLLFFSYEQVRFLSARFWFVLWFALHAVWVWYIYTKWQKLPEIKKELEARREFKKYIP